ncbi:MAG: hypothetical protein EOP84_10180 [Verrucomicrobiaceae bacterium]|nr:MAG: hypothetical protein EOP84_10180 [Verrucomicrobiaceae bacterium]
MDILLRLIAAAKARVRSFACVGADLALLAGAILEEHPNTRGLLIDTLPDIPGISQRQLSIPDPEISVIELTSAGTDCPPTLARFAPYDTVVLGSELQIDNKERLTLIREIFRLLNPGGVLLSVGDVHSPVRWTGAPLEDHLIEAIFGEELRAAPDRTGREIAHAYFAKNEDRADITAPLEVQCDWLREAGFVSVDCYVRTVDLTVFGGQCPEGIK